MSVLRAHPSTPRHGRARHRADRPALARRVPVQHSRAVAPLALQPATPPDGSPGRAGHVVPALLTVATLLGGLALSLLITPRVDEAPAPNGPTPAPPAAVAVTLGGEASVTSSATFTTGASELHLSVPDRTGLLSGYAPAVSDVRVTVDGREVEVAGSLASGERSTVPLPGGSSEITVTYSSTGTVRRSVGSTPPRGLVLLTPVRIRELEGRPLHVEVADTRVRNLGCVTGQVMATCGSGTATGWEVDSDDGAADVLAQVDLG